MSKNKWDKEERIAKCTNKITIRNFSKKKFKVILQAVDAEPIGKDDFHVSITSGKWIFELCCDEPLLEDLKTVEAMNDE